MLLWRLLTALVLAPLVLGAIVLGGGAIPVALLVVLAFAAYELAFTFEVPSLAAFGAGALPIVLSIPFGANGVLAGVVIGLPWALIWLAVRPGTRTLRAVLAFLLMALWVGVPLAHLGLIEGLPDGKYLLLLTVVGPWISDTGAYFAGRLFGRRKLFPTLSPKKTYEGGIGGLLLTIAAAGAFAYGFLGFSIVQGAILGAAISVFSQAGDLFESTLKRILDLKELGNMLPGHGGILDRIDSLLFAAPATYYLYALFVP